MKKILMIVSIIGTLSFADTNPVKVQNYLLKMLIKKDLSAICDQVIKMNRKSKKRAFIIKKEDCMKELK